MMDTSHASAVVVVPRLADAAGGIALHSRRTMRRRGHVPLTRLSAQNGDGTGSAGSHATGAAAAAKDVQELEKRVSALQQRAAEQMTSAEWSQGESAQMRLWDDNSNPRVDIALMMKRNELLERLAYSQITLLREQSDMLRSLVGDLPDKAQQSGAADGEEEFYLTGDASGRRPPRMTVDRVRRGAVSTKATNQNYDAD